VIAGIRLPFPAPSRCISLVRKRLSFDTARESQTVYLPNFSGYDDVEAELLLLEGECSAGQKTINNLPDNMSGRRVRTSHSHLCEAR